MAEEKPEKRAEGPPTAEVPGRKPPRRAATRPTTKAEDPPGDPWRVIAQVLNKQPRRKH
jgi:hypothetical protein